jgi:hypothetical protein
VAAGASSEEASSDPTARELDAVLIGAFLARALLSSNGRAEEHGDAEGAAAADDAGLRQLHAFLRPEQDGQRWRQLLDPAAAPAASGSLPPQVQALSRQPAPAPPPRVESHRSGAVLLRKRDTLPST